MFVGRIFSAFPFNFHNFDSQYREIAIKKNVTEKVSPSFPAAKTFAENSFAMEWNE